MLIIDLFIENILLIKNIKLLLRKSLAHGGSCIVYTPIKSKIHRLKLITVLIDSFDENKRNQCSNETN